MSFSSLIYAQAFGMTKSSINWQTMSVYFCNKDTNDRRESVAQLSIVQQSGLC